VKTSEQFLSTPSDLSIITCDHSACGLPSNQVSEECIQKTIAKSAIDAASNSNVKAIIVMNFDDSLAWKISKCKPQCLIIRYLILHNFN
jgi:pyruvate kinase